MAFLKENLRALQVHFKFNGFQMNLLSINPLTLIYLRKVAATSVRR